MHQIERNSVGQRDYLPGLFLNAFCLARSPHIHPAVVTVACDIGSSRDRSYQPDGGLRALGSRLEKSHHLRARN